MRLPCHNYHDYYNLFFKKRGRQQKLLIGWHNINVKTYFSNL